MGHEYLLSVGQTLAVFGNVLSDEDVGVIKQDVEQLVDTVQTFLPHVRLQSSKWVNFSEFLTEKGHYGGRRFESYLHEGCQVGVVVVQGGNDVELYFHHDALTQVVLSSDRCQSVKQFDLGGSVRERREE